MLKHLSAHIPCRNIDFLKREKLAPSLPITRFSLKKNTFEAYLYEDINKVPPLPEFLQDNFLTPNYQNVLHKEAPKGMRLGYLVFQQKNNIIGFAVCQTVRFDAAENIRLPAANEDKNWSKKAKVHFQRSIAQQFSFNSIVCGNLLVPGEHGFAFDKAVIAYDDFLHLVIEATEALRIKWSAEEKPYSAVIFKDFVQPMSALVNAGFTEMELPPFMKVTLDENWKKFEDYLAPMQSKYRVRARRAQKKASAIVKKELNEAHITANEAELMALHQQVLGSASFNLVDITSSYFAELKRQAQDDFQLFAYYLEGKLVAFYTLIRNNTELEAHFLGFDQQLNHEYQIYLNILYDIVNAGITMGNIKTIQMARTAMEIKSSVGAEPETTYVYMRHESCTYTKLFGMAYRHAYPHEVWQARHPFKKEEDANIS